MTELILDLYGSQRGLLILFTFIGYIYGTWKSSFLYKHTWFRRHITVTFYCLLYTVIGALFVPFGKYMTQLPWVGDGVDWMKNYVIGWSPTSVFWFDNREDNVIWRLSVWGIVLFGLFWRFIFRMYLIISHQRFVGAKHEDEQEYINVLNNHGFDIKVKDTIFGNLISLEEGNRIRWFRSVVNELAENYGYSSKYKDKRTTGV